MSSSVIDITSSSESDSDNSVELVYDSALSSDKKTSPDEYKSATSKNGSVSSIEIKSISKSSVKTLPDSNPLSSPPLTHYRCVKFDPMSEVELMVRKWHTRSQSARGAPGEGQQGPEPSTEELGK